MDQQTLRALEDQCIQEHAPTCNAACPVHVDVRALCAEVARGDYRAGLRVLRKAVPFPGIISRICDRPCYETCLRKELGGSIHIMDLERACVEFSGEYEKATALPARGKRVAVIGGGLSGLTVSYDLIRKGIRVMIFDHAAKLGGNLWKISDKMLPPAVIERDTQILSEMGVEQHLGVTVESIEVDDDGKPVVLGETFDAVYLGIGSHPPLDFGLKLGEPGGLEVDPVTYQTSRGGLFAGGGAIRHTPERLSSLNGSGVALSPIEAVSDGRRAATSIDRYLQRVSLTAARNREGAYVTRLYTNLKGIPPARATEPRNPGQGYQRDEAVQEAERCIQCECMECVKVCEYLKQYGSYPKRYVREIYNNLSIVKGERQKNQFINSCSLCGLCAEVCPERLDMGQVCREARETMTAQKRMPPSAHDFALRDMAFSNGEQFALFRNQPGTSHSSYVFFPGCQLCASAPGQVEQVYAYLTERLGKGAAPAGGVGSTPAGGVGLALGCCGAPADWAGERGVFQAAQAEFRERLRALGEPEIILACSSCYAVFKQHYSDLKIHSLWTVLDREGYTPPARASGDSPPAAIHDPCSTRYETEIQDSVRRLMERGGYAVQELPLSRERTECCGFGGQMWLANPALTEKVLRRRAGESPLDYVTYCAVCRDFYAKAGKPTLHLLDLLMPAPGQAATRPGPDASRRRENRARLRNHLLRDLWGETMADLPPYQHIELVMDDTVRTLLDQRLILTEDLRQVIEYAERTGYKFVNPSTGRSLAHAAPGCVTYWVDYAPDGAAFRVFNAYSHRMVIQEKPRP